MTATTVLRRSPRFVRRSPRRGDGSGRAFVISANKTMVMPVTLAGTNWKKFGDDKTQAVRVVLQNKPGFKWSDRQQQLQKSKFRLILQDVNDSKRGGSAVRKRSTKRKNELATKQRKTAKTAVPTPPKKTKRKAALAAAVAIATTGSKKTKSKVAAKSQSSP